MFADDWFPIQVKQTDKVGWPDIDAFQPVMLREGENGGLFLTVHRRTVERGSANLWARVAGPTFAGVVGYEGRVSRALICILYGDLRLRGSRGSGTSHARLPYQVAELRNHLTRLRSFSIEVSFDSASSSDFCSLRISAAFCLSTPPRISRLSWACAAAARAFSISHRFSRSLGHSPIPTS